VHLPATNKGKEEEDGCFTLLGIFEARKTRPGECGSLGRADPHLKFSASVKKFTSPTQDVILQIPTVSMCTIVLGTSRKHLKMIQWLMTPGK